MSDQFLESLTGLTEEQVLTLHFVLYNDAAELRALLTGTLRPTQLALKAARSRLKCAMEATQLPALKVDTGAVCKLTTRQTCGRDLNPLNTVNVLAAVRWEEAVCALQAQRAAVAAASSSPSSSPPKTKLVCARPPLAADVEASPCQLVAQCAYDALYAAHKPRRAVLSFATRAAKGVSSVPVAEAPPEVASAWVHYVAAKSAADAAKAAKQEEQARLKVTRERLAWLRPGITEYAVAMGGTLCRELTLPGGGGVRRMTARVVTKPKLARSLTLQEMSGVVDEAAAAAGTPPDLAKFLTTLRELVEAALAAKTQVVTALSTRRHKLRPGEEGEEEEEEEEEQEEEEKDPQGDEEEEEEDGEGAAAAAAVVPSPDFVPMLE